MLFGSKWSCLLLRIVLRNALSEVVKVLSAHEAEGCCGRYHSLYGRAAQGLPEVVEKVLSMMTMDVEEKGWELSITEGGKEEKSKVIASWPVPGREVPGMGVGLGHSVET